ncbi:ANE_G0016350.mRNA.1.CDS.1 [Saccharomyces cerevisiae]|nr:ANE_G0016350.mRNA.1.CDS.1 [Saccharomyces cerevisiae]CAI6637411.1 ANE_G0016350.mRNA.1.CDS.1 [Saccharomyces cerevisiae]
MLRNDEEYKEYLEDIEPYHGDPRKRGEIYSQIQEIMLGTWPLLEEEKQLVYWIRQGGKQGSQVFRMSGRQIKELYFKVWSNLRESKTEVLQSFGTGTRKVPGRNGRQKTIRVFVEALEKSWSFSAFAFHDERWTAGVRSTSSCSLAGIIDS